MEEAVIKSGTEGFCDVTFENPSIDTTYFGKNGTGKCSGVMVVSYHNDKVSLIPINSNGVPTTGCTIDIPKKHLREVAIALQEDVLLEAMRRLPIEMIPRFVGSDPVLEDLAKKILARSEDIA